MSCVVCGLTELDICERHKTKYRFIAEHGFWCLKPRKKISKGQTGLYRSVKKVLKLPTYQEVIFPDIPMRRYDIGVPSLKLILEFHGRQHYELVKLFHGDKDGFKKQVEDDILREKIVRSFGYDFIIFSLAENVSDPEYVKKKLKLRGYDV